MGAREITLRFMAAPTDVAALGESAVAGGRVLEWIDKAAYACAVGWSGGYCVTAYVGNVNFARPIHSGDVVEVEARLVHTGRSRMHVEVSVSSADPQHAEYAFATSCTVIFVAVGGDGRPVPVHQWVPVTDDDLERDAMAVDKTSVRADIEAALPCGADGRQLGRQDPRRHRHALDRRGGVRVCRGLERRQLRGGVLRRNPVLPAHHDRAHRRGPGPAVAHRAQQHARLGACQIGRSEGTADAAHDTLPDHFRGPGRSASAGSGSPLDTGDG
jgi:acyl-CoA hydrolase